MCVVCGCSATGSDGVAVDPVTGDLHFGAGPAGVTVPGLGTARTIALEADVLGANNRVAGRNRAHFQAHGVTALNLVSSPGSGKTTLLCATIEALRRRDPQRAVGVIEGDQQTSNDAARIRATGAPAVQVNTGKGCHLDAPMVEAAFARLSLHGHAHAHPHEHGPADHAEGRLARGNGPATMHVHGPSTPRTSPHDLHQDIGPDRPHDGADDLHHLPATLIAAGSPPPAAAGPLLFIENVGNLVCPAMWDLGEAAKVVVLSVTEGEDKPLKYPDMFAAARLMVLNKVDLLPYVDFDVAACIAHAQRVNPGIEVLLVSATRGQGMEAWLDWLQELPPPWAQPAPAVVASVA